MKQYLQPTKFVREIILRGKPDEEWNPELIEVTEEIIRSLNDNSVQNIYVFGDRLVVAEFTDEGDARAFMLNLEDIYSFEGAYGAGMWIVDNQSFVEKVVVFYCRPED